jgi:hypothetical protein
MWWCVCVVCGVQLVASKTTEATVKELNLSQYKLVTADPVPAPAPLSTGGSQTLPHGFVMPSGSRTPPRAHTPPPGQQQQPQQFTFLPVTPTAGAAPVMGTPQYVPPSPQNVVYVDASGRPIQFVATPHHMAPAGAAAPKPRPSEI